MNRQQQKERYYVTGADEDGAPATNASSSGEEARVRFYRRLLYANATLIATFIAISSVLPLTETEHWTVSLVAAGLLGLNLAMIDESRRRERRYRGCALEADRSGDYSDLFVDF